ncbi:MAG: D-glycero-D-manno-heptose 1,7-bisphosphate phosphatase [Actinomycetota bacterium]|nr:D-glycero-D-manno-heptose 1,7-bisphosphate phosphatase [Actinomycetota bacterium]
MFLDRDGTLNHCFPTADGATTRPPQSIDELTLVDRAGESCARLRAAGFALFLVTNQPDVARGTQSRDRVDAMNRHLVSVLGLEGAAACYHDDADRCLCRKPQPGLILTLADQHGIDVAGSWVVGDRASDVLAGQAAGCRTVLVARTSAEPHPQDHHVPSLAAAADLILAHRHAHHATSGSRHAS